MQYTIYLMNIARFHKIRSFFRARLITHVRATYSIAAKKIEMQSKILNATTQLTETG